MMVGLCPIHPASVALPVVSLGWEELNGIGLLGLFPSGLVSGTGTGKVRAGFPQWAIHLPGRLVSCLVVVFPGSVWLTPSLPLGIRQGCRQN